MVRVVMMVLMVMVMVMAGDGNANADADADVDADGEMVILMVMVMMVVTLLMSIVVDFDECRSHRKLTGSFSTSLSYSDLKKEELPHLPKTLSVTHLEKPSTFKNRVDDAGVLMVMPGCSDGAG